jgi:hypothetical protein
MAATGISNANIWKEVASERERSARLMTLVSVALGFGLLATFSYSYASASRMSDLCTQIQEISVTGGKSAREVAATLAANYCS